MFIKKKKQSTKHITKKMAERTALNVQAYWAEKGYSIHVWVERVTFGNARDYAVRSDMKDGFPNSKS
tara:strand:+ start:235 stop:435 length:201 start_codon:yes stop_codon:yes gene_type:complete